MSCSTDNIENGPSSLDIEIVPAWDITRGITSASQTVKLTVNLNVQTIHWQVSSDSEWCKVDSDLIHTGSDEVELVVESNDSFDKRNAVLTVTAGRYTRKVEIDQAGNVFVMSDVYKILGSNEALSYDVEVRTTSEWTIEAPDWIEAEKVGTPTVDEFGQTTTVMHVSIDANPGEQSRYGAVQLIPTEGYNGEFTVFQFGSEVNMTDDGKIAVAAEGNVSFEVTAPFGIIEKVEVPYWVQCTETPAEDGLNSVFEFWIAKTSVTRRPDANALSSSRSRTAAGPSRCQLSRRTSCPQAASLRDPDSRCSPRHGTPAKISPTGPLKTKAACS